MKGKGGSNLVKNWFSRSAKLGKGQNQELFPPILFLNHDSVHYSAANLLKSAPISKENLNPVRFHKFPINPSKAKVNVESHKILSSQIMQMEDYSFSIFIV